MDVSNIFFEPTMTHICAPWTMNRGMTDRSSVATDGDPPRCFITVGIEMNDSGYTLILSWTTTLATSCYLYDNLDGFVQLGEGLSGFWSKPAPSGQTAMNVLAAMIGQQTVLIGQTVPITVTIG